jgi:hypothetical protein
MIDKEALLAPRLAEREVVLPVGSVRVRALNRIEAMRVQAAGEAGGPAAADRVMIALGMVDPVLTEAEVSAWQASAPAMELEPVTDAIAALSGMQPDATKAAYKGFEDDPGAEFRPLPGGEAADAGLAAAADPAE